MQVAARRQAETLGLLADAVPGKRAAGPGGARAVGTCSPRGSRSPPHGRPAEYPRPSQADFLPLPKLHFPASSPLSGRKRKQILGCEGATLRRAPLLVPRPSGALL